MEKLAIFAVLFIILIAIFLVVIGFLFAKIGFWAILWGLAAIGLFKLLFG